MKRKSSLKLVSTLCLLVACALFPLRDAHAVNVTVDHALSEEVVEIGDPVTLTLRVLLDDNVVLHSPQLEVPAGFATSRANVQSNIQMNGSDFRMEYVARWVLVPDVLGTFEIGPPSVDVSGTRVAAKGALSLKVMGKGKGPPKRNKPSQPAPGFAGMGQFFAPKAPFDLDDPFFDYQRPRRGFLDGRALKLDKALDPSVFLYIHADKTEVKLGEQVILSYWAYFNVDIMGLENYQEPPLSAFTREVLSVPAETRRGAVTTSVGGRLFNAKQYGEVAIFPVRAGELTTGAWSADVEVLRAGGRRVVPRVSNEVVIKVSEAPKKGRPLGFKAGTVGRYKMTADVDPRETYVGDTTSVSVQVTGVGQMPSELHLPERLGVEWLKPERKTGLSMVHHNVGGWRTFTYVVRFTKSGTIDLGKIELPYFDPDKETYEVASADLGAVKVQPQADGAGGGALTPTANEDEEKDPFEGMPGWRAELSPFDAEHDNTLAPNTLWTWVVAPPVGVALTSLFAAGLRRARRRRQSNKDDPATRARAALGDMDRQDDAKDAAAAAERALHLAVEAATGLKSRGMLRSELEVALNKQLSDDALTGDVLSLLDTCSSVRFEPVDTEDDVSRVRREAHAVVKALLSR